nr:hypothetical protein [Candidatus Sigynarchaeota archaeon]
MIRHAKRQAGRGWYSKFTILPFVAPPEDSGCLKAALKVDQLEHGKPVHPHDKGVWYVDRKEN